MADEGSDSRFEDRIAELERRVEELQATVEDRERTINMLVAEADIEPLTANCPKCGEPGLQRRSGLSWVKLTCSGCNTEWNI